MDSVVLFSLFCIVIIFVVAFLIAFLIASVNGKKSIRDDLFRCNEKGKKYFAKKDDVTARDIIEFMQGNYGYIFSSIIIGFIAVTMGIGLFFIFGLTSTLKWLAFCVCIYLFTIGLIWVCKKTTDYEAKIRTYKKQVDKQILPEVYHEIRNNLVMAIGGGIIITQKYLIFRIFPGKVVAEIFPVDKIERIWSSTYLGVLMIHIQLKGGEGEYTHSLGRFDARYNQVVLEAIKIFWEQKGKFEVS